MNETLNFITEYTTKANEGIFKACHPQGLKSQQESLIVKLLGGSSMSDTLRFLLFVLELWKALHCIRKYFSMFYCFKSITIVFLGLNNHENGPQYFIAKNLLNVKL